MERLCPDQTKETNSNKQFLYISFLRVSGLGSRVFRVKGLGFRVLGLAV